MINKTPHLASKFFISTSLFLFFALLAAPSLAVNTTDLYFFYSSTCPHCQQEKTHLDALEQTYGDGLILHEYELNTSAEGQELLLKMSRAYNAKTGSVPITFIGDEVINGALLDKITEKVKTCSEQGCVNPLKKTNTYISEHPDEFNDLTAKNNNAIFTYIGIGVIGAIIVIAVVIALKK